MLLGVAVGKWVEGVDVGSKDARGQVQQFVLELSIPVHPSTVFLPSLSWQTKPNMHSSSLSQCPWQRPHGFLRLQFLTFFVKGTGRKSRFSVGVGCGVIVGCDDGVMLGLVEGSALVVGFIDDARDGPWDGLLVGDVVFDGGLDEEVGDSVLTDGLAVVGALDGW